jgi:hypothetical protein
MRGADCLFLGRSELALLRTTPARAPVPMVSTRQDPESCAAVKVSCRPLSGREGDRTQSHAHRNTSRLSHRHHAAQCIVAM